MNPLRLPQLLLACVLAVSAHAVTLSGKITDTRGNGLYGVVIAYRTSDRVVAGRVNSTLSGPNIGSYSLSLPTGEYEFYVRAFGYAPIEERNVAVPGDLTRNFTINPLAGREVPSYLKTSTVSPQYVFASTPGSTSTYTLQSTSSLGVSVALFNEFASFTVDGETTGTIDLFDNGTHGDAVGGDFIYSRANVGFNGATGARCGQFASGQMLYARVSTPAAPAPAIVAVPAATIIAVNPTTFATTVMDAQTRYTQFAANIVFDASKEGFQKEAAKQFYRKFADVYDFIYMIPDRSIGVAGFCQRVRNDATGIGLPISDDSLQYGSAGKLRSVLLINAGDSPPLLHETMHTWATWITPPFDAATGGHWGYSGVNGVLGGFDATKLVAHPDGSWSVPQVAVNGWANDTVKYAPLELYLAGLAPLSSVPAVPVFTNLELIGGSATEFRGTRTDVSGADLVARYGARNPAFAVAPKRFRVAVVGVTAKPLDAAGMAYLSILGQQLSGIGPNCILALSFANATGGAGAMDAHIVPRGGLTKLHAARH
ncbi:MAG TPA: carboxypeptidase-like regulatory domain-containing protein [Thermoanaerobaculia bacterium]|jgi:hypothetical protein